MSTARKLPSTLIEAVRYFADADLALAFMAELRWPNGPVCPHCDATEPSFLKTRRIWKCRECRKQFSIKVGTIFEDSPLGLDKWLPALWLLANAKNGISSYEIARALGVTQKTAWFMLSRIRLAMQTKTFTSKLGGKGRDVEVDETFVGGLGKFMHKSKRERLSGTGIVDKVAVMGLLERKRGPKHSIVRASVVANTKRRELEPRVVANVAPRSNVYTDAHLSYSKLRERDYEHAAIDHAVAYVNGQIHTNGLENF